MLKKLFQALTAAMLLSLSATAFAQCVDPRVFPEPTVWDGARRCRVPMGTPPVGYNVPQPVYNPYYGGQPGYGGPPAGMLPVQGYPSFFQQGGNLYRCSALASWGGGLLGAGVGYAIGKNVTVNGHRLSGLGAVLGAVAGNQIACELVARPPAPMPIYAQPQPVMHNGQPIPAEQQVGGFHQVPNQPSVRTTFVPQDCDIGGRPDLQNLSVSPAQCEVIRNALRVSKPGHCIIGGISYPELVDNEPGCLAKHAEVTALAKARAGQGSAPAQAAAPSMPPVAQTIGTPRVKACTVNTGEKIYTFNAVDGVKFGKDQCDRYLAKLDPLPEERSMSVLP